MKKIILIYCLSIFTFISNAFSNEVGGLKKGTLNLSNATVEILGNYTIHHMLFPKEEWKFYILVVPENTKQGDLIKIAKEFYKKYPKTRARFFADKKYIKQYVLRDIYVNDTTGKAKEVNFPPDEWVQNYLLGNINNRSEANNRKWMLEDRYGNLIQFMD